MLTALVGLPACHTSATYNSNCGSQVSPSPSPPPPMQPGRYESFESNDCAGCLSGGGLYCSVHDNEHNDDDNPGNSFCIPKGRIRLVRDRVDGLSNRGLCASDPLLSYISRHPHLYVSPFDAHWDCTFQGGRPQVRK